MQLGPHGSLQPPPSVNAAISPTPTTPPPIAARFPTLTPSPSLAPSPRHTPAATEVMPLAWFHSSPARDKLLSRSINHPIMLVKKLMLNLLKNKGSSPTLQQEKGSSF